MVYTNHKDTVTTLRAPCSCVWAGTEAGPAGWSLSCLLRVHVHSESVMLQWMGSVNEMMFSYGTFAWLWLDGCLVLYFAFSGSYCDSHFTHLTSNFSLILCTRQCFYWTLNWFQQVLIVRGLCLCFQLKLDDISQGRRAPPAGSTAAKIPPEVSFPKKYFTFLVVFPQHQLFAFPRKPSCSVKKRNLNASSRFFACSLLGFRSSGLFGC